MMFSKPYPKCPVIVILEDNKFVQQNIGNNLLVVW